MRKTKYFYFPPAKKIYYFPISGPSQIFQFYKPYSLPAKLLWFLVIRFQIIRRLFVVSDKKLPFNIEEIKKFIKNENNNVAVKISDDKSLCKFAGMFINYENEFQIVKFAYDEESQKMYQNEIKILKQLPECKNFPTLLSYIITNRLTIFTTSCLKGRKYSRTVLNEKILDVIIKINKQRIDTQINYKMDLQMAFAHGDFCPWNLLEEDNLIKVYDWEMAGNYPLGYDLFTFIFQTSYLLNPYKENNLLIEINKLFIISYFKNFGNLSWISYLIAFGNIKYINEQTKNGKLKIRYKELIEYAKTL